MTTSRLSNRSAEKPELREKYRPISFEETANNGRRFADSSSVLPLNDADSERREKAVSYSASSSRLRTVAQIPDCRGEFTKRENDQIPLRHREDVSEHSSRGRIWLRRGAVALFWMTGLITGFMGSKVENFYSRQVLENAGSEVIGEYSVSEIAESEKEEADSSFQKKIVSVSAEKSDFDSLPAWEDDSFDTIPVWQPAEESTFYAADTKSADEADRFSYPGKETETMNKPEEASFGVSEENAAAVSQEFSSEYPAHLVLNAEEDTDFGSDFSEKESFNTEDIMASVPQEFAAASDRPMKNQVEYFEPFDTQGNVETDKAEPVKMAASQDFYESANEFGNFSDYNVPVIEKDKPVSFNEWSSEER